jgi:hypothetical protein
MVQVLAILLHERGARKKDLLTIAAKYTQLLTAWQYVTIGVRFGRGWTSRRHMRRHADWFRQSQRKLESARWDIQGKFYEDACFSAQQAAELAKALLESQGRIELGPSAYHLLQTAGSVPQNVLDAARVLGRLAAGVLASLMG